MEKQYVVYEVAGVLYGVSIGQVQEIMQKVELKSLPKSERGIKGMVEYRGQVVPIYSLRVLYCEEDRDLDVVIMVRDGELVRGFQVDRIRSIEALGEDEIEDVPVTLESAKYINGVGKKGSELIMLVDLTSEAYMVQN